MTVSLSGLSCLVILLPTICNLYFIFPSHFVYDYTRLLHFPPVPNCFPPKKRTMNYKVLFLACEQALLFGRVKEVSRERASERHSREARFACPNNRACSQASCFFVGVQGKRLSRTESFVEASILCCHKLECFTAHQM